METTILILIGLALFLGSSFGGTWSPLKRSKYSALSNYWYIVSVVETGNFTSPLYHKANNLFGMKQPKVRKTTSIGETSAIEGMFATYSSKRSSVEDIVLYMDAMNYPQNFVDLKTFVFYMKDKGYYGISAEAYYAACVAWAAKLNLPTNQLA